MTIQSNHWHDQSGRCAFCTDHSPDSLDAAWAEAEAALPEGWAMLQLHHTAMMDQRWQAEAQSRIGPVVAWNRVRTVIAEGLTPAAALRALTAKLRERAG